MSNRRRDWTPYGMPQIASRLGRVSLGFLVSNDPDQTPRSNGTLTEDSREMLTSEAPTLYWISKSAVDVAAGLAANGVPNHSVAELLRSSNIAPSGLMCFEKPLGSLKWQVSPDDEIEVPWDAVTWGPMPDTRFDQLEDRPFFIALLSRMAKHRYLLDLDERQIPLQKVDLLLVMINEPLSRGGEHWTEGSQGSLCELDESLAAGLDTTTALLTSVLLTAGQPRITAQRLVGIDDGVVTARRDRDEDTQIEPEVVLIDLLRPPGSASDQEATAKRKDFDHRWWVRGHWKMQPYGPLRQLRKIIYIAPHTAGPDDKPLSTSPRVNVIRADPPRPAGDDGNQCLPDE